MEEEEGQFVDPFLYTSAKFGGNENDQPLCSDDTSFPTSVVPSKNSLERSEMADTLLEEVGLRSDDEESENLLGNIEEEEESFAEVAEDQLVLNQFIEMQARDQEKQRRVVNLDLV